MARDVIDFGDGFWNLRGSFRVGGLLDVGTQASLVRRPNGRFLLLDSWSLTPAQKQAVMALTGGGALIDAVLNLHPFHTLHCAAVHQEFPDARLYGTARHHRRLDELPWQPEPIESAEAQALFADTLDFDIPRGVAFIADDPKLHFSSVLAVHRASRFLHVDDTLTVLRPPQPLRWLGARPRLSFHPTLAKVLAPRAGAEEEFRAWAEALAARCDGLRGLVAAHVSGPLIPAPGEPGLGERVRRALARVEPVLAAHAAAHRKAA